MSLNIAQVTNDSSCYPAHREVDDGGVFLDEEIVLGEPFVTNDEIRRKFGEFESFQRRVPIRFVLFFSDAVELGHDREQRDLRNDVLFHVVWDFVKE